MDSVAKQNELGVAVANPGVARQNFVPVALRVVEDKGHELNLRLLLGRGLARRGPRGGRGAGIARKQRKEVVPENQAQQAHNENAAESQTSAAKASETAATAAFVAAIFQIVTGSAGRPLHISSVYALDARKSA
jgi:hypothetical protein